MLWLILGIIAAILVAYFVLIQIVKILFYDHNIYKKIGLILVCVLLYFGFVFVIPMITSLFERLQKSIEAGETNTILSLLWIVIAILLGLSLVVAMIFALPFVKDDRSYFIYTLGIFILWVIYSMMYFIIISAAMIDDILLVTLVFECILIASLYITQYFKIFQGGFIKILLNILIGLVSCTLGFCILVWLHRNMSKLLKICWIE